GIISATLVAKGFVTPSREQIYNVGSNTRWMITALLFFLWVMLMPVIGFFVSTVLFMTAIVVYLARSRIKVTPRKLLAWFPIIVAEVTFFYLIFTKILHVPLPRGLFF
ncbi:MAG: tripartite tricarboxylate transporter TctB family protein, partial [Deltaproteobacteria bacterium]